LHKGEYVLSHRDVEKAKSGGGGVLRKVRRD